MRPTALTIALTIALALSFQGGCGGQPAVVVYSALDQVHSEPIVRQFEKDTGIRVKAVYDVEAVKTIGLVNKIVEEAGNPKCDVFWNNELVHTVRLKNKGLLAPYRSPAAEGIPAGFKDPEGYWTGFAARGRVLILNTEVMKATEPDEAKWPKETRDLLDPKWKGKAVMAKPLAGTTLTHMAILWALEGPDFVKNFWTGFAAVDGRIATGNAHAMKEVAAGSFAFGYTDTDDYYKAVLDGKPVRQVFPDQDPAGEVPGVIFIPNSIALVKGGPNQEMAKKFIDYVLAEKVEAALAAGPSAQIPVRKSVPRPAHVKSASEFLSLPIDWTKVAEAVEPVTTWLSGHLAGGR
ncbi:MAG: extracellular solute-binding protein [Planctomycetes bacterium]|jgi:iron(III) transport system substrate-binding protein|nr:extracellular solute-binding protein [Planctomycetota bacterium]